MVKKSLLVVMGLLTAWTAVTAGPHPVPAEPVRKSWADSVLQTLSLDQKIAQLMMLRIYSNKNKAYGDTMVARQARYQWGGYCFFQSYPVCQAQLTNRLQAVSQLPAMISIDGEWGLAMRLDSIGLYPRQMALGASRDTAGIYEMGRQMALQCHRIGVHVNFAPDIDINNNANNPVINSRSFGSEPTLVARCGIAYLRGMQDNGLLTTIKHFPGHGDTETDSHAATPSITHSRKHIQKMELAPFAAAIRAGADGIMVGHLRVPALDSEYIATASREIMTGLLREEMGFKGLICTDALEMKGISSLYAPGELELQVLRAGADLLLLPTDAVAALEKIRAAVLAGELDESLIDARCLNILRMKEKYVLPYVRPVETEHLVEDLNSAASARIYRHLTEESLTLLKNRHHIVPLAEKTQKIAHLRIDNSGNTVLDTFFYRTYGTQTFRIAPRQAADTQLLRPFFRAADTAGLVVVTLSCLSQYPEKNQYGLTPDIARLVDTLAEHHRLLLIVMGNPYCLNFLPSAHRIPAILIAYHPVALAEEAVADALSHRIGLQGRLPVGLNAFSQGEGEDICVQPSLHPAFGEPESRWDGIDSLVKKGLDAKAFPGCQVLAAQQAQIVYRKAFGTMSYEDSRPVTMETVYDLASVTKALSTTLAVMKLYEDGKIQLEDPLSRYLPYLKGSDKEQMTVAEVMTHTAGLKDWIPFYTLWNGGIYRSESDETYAVPVCAGMYMRKDYADSMRRRIAAEPLRKDRSYKYSDLGFYLLADLVKAVSGLRLDTFVTETFYRPLEMTRTAYNPFLYFPLDQIAPTENDCTFRKQLVRGYVHDQGAAMWGGVSGHAGLFSTADDLAVLLQMLLNGGEYRGRTFLQEETIRKFTKYYCPSVCRRGLGFDKPSLSGPTPCGRLASADSYGHSGFTGTFFWVDPQNQTLYIFLSNRVCPDAENNRLSAMNIRTDIQDYVYQSLNAGGKKDLDKLPEDNEKSATFARPVKQCRTHRH